MYYKSREKLNKGKQMFNFKDVIEAVEHAPSGSYVGITDYVDNKGNVSSVIGQIGCSYEHLKDFNMQVINDAIDLDDFPSIHIEGDCYYDESKDEFNARKRSCPLKHFDVDYNAEEVKKAVVVLKESIQTPRTKNTTKTQLTSKENGLYVENETGNINFLLLVEKQYYKEEKSKLLKESNKFTGKVKVSSPESILKEKIRNMFTRKIKSFTIGKDKFSELSINKVKFIND